MNPFVYCDYQEWHPSTYAGIVVQHGGKKMRFFSGNFDRDLRRAKAHVLSLRAGNAAISSTIDNFQMDRQQELAMA